jgi:hypothetical protein
LCAGSSRCSTRTQNENPIPNPDSDRIAVFIGNNNQLSAPEGDNPELQHLPAVQRGGIEMMTDLECREEEQEAICQMRDIEQGITQLGGDEEEEE